MSPASRVVALATSLCIVERAQAASTCTADVSVADHSDASVDGSIAACAKSLGSAGGTILVPGVSTGSYQTSGALVLTSNLTLRGDGADVSVIEYFGSGATDVLTNRGSAVSAVKIKDLKVMGTGVAGQTCINITRRSGEHDNDTITLSGLVIESCGEYGAYLYGVSGLLVDELTLTQNGLDAARGNNLYLREVDNASVDDVGSALAAANGIAVLDSSDVLIRSPMVAANGKHGVRVLSSSNIKITDAVAIANGEMGIAVQSTSSEACVQNSAMLSNGTYGMEIKTVDGYQLTSNRLAGNGLSDTHTSASVADITSCDATPSDETVFPFAK